MQSLHAYRTALERRRDHYSSAWRWSFWPVIPSVIIVFGGGLLFDERPGKWLRYSLSAVVCAVAFLCAAWVSWRKSAGFQREIDALETLDENAPRGAGRGGERACFRRDQQSRRTRDALRQWAPDRYLNTGLAIVSQRAAAATRAST